MNKIKKIAMSAVAASIIWSFILMAIIYSATIRPETGLIWILKFTVLLLWTVVVVVWWIRYMRAYVSNAMERKLNETGRQVSTIAEQDQRQ